MQTSKTLREQQDAAFMALLERRNPALARRHRMRREAIASGNTTAQRQAR